MTATAVSYRKHMARCLMGAAFLVQLPALAQAAEWPSALNLSTLDGNIGFRLDGEAGSQSGFSVSAAGDVNGDGLGDVIVGTRFVNTSFVVFGKAGSFGAAFNLSALDGSNGFKLAGTGSAGQSASRAGDVNGDGLGDIIIGAPDGNPNGLTQSGSSYVVFGKAGGFASVLDLSALNGTTGFRLNGEALFDYSGRSVSAAGDVNGDGFGDVFIGAFAADHNGSYSGSSYVVFGKATPFSSEVNLSSLNGATGFRLDGSGFSGVSVAAAGDVNGDGFDDVIVGSGANASHVVFGKAGSFAPAVNLSALNGTTGFRLNGAAGDYSGLSVAAAGDVNGDGFGDVIVGAPQADPMGADSGSSYVVFGKANGFQPVVNLSALNGASGFRLDGAMIDERFGQSVASAGDLNGDGFSDVIVGAKYSGWNGNQKSGSSYVVFGRAGGFPPVVNNSSLNGTTGFRLEGEVSQDRSGTSVATAGDVNGDGFADVIVGAPGGDHNAGYTGSSYVIYGREPEAAVLRAGTRAKQVIQGSAFDDALVASSLGDTLEGREGGDLLIGDLSTTASYAHAGAGVSVNLATGIHTGDALDDVLYLISNLEGSGHADTLTGNGKANILTGGKEKDTLKGGGSKDTFSYLLTIDSPAGSATRDQILDFNPGTKSSSVDKIDLAGVDAKSSVNGNQAFTFRGTKAFNGSGQVRLKKSGADVIILGNTGGSTAPEFEIVLKGLAAKVGRITAKDFKL